MDYISLIFCVQIYPSEFGKERMKEEQVQGPVELLSIPEDAPEKDWYWVTLEYKTNPSKVTYFTRNSITLIGLKFALNTNR